MKEAHIRSRVRGALAGLAIGDGLGVPVETLTHEQILERTGGQGIVGYVRPDLFRDTKDSRGKPPGSTSDDTQLTLAVNRSLVRCRRFDLTDQARALVEEFDGGQFGWGGTTRDAAVALKKWFESGGKEGRHPEQSAPPPTENRGSGSGVAMRIAPLALLCFARAGTDGRLRGLEPFLSQTRALGMQTHGAPDAWIAAATLGLTIGAAACEGESSHPRDLFRAIDARLPPATREESRFLMNLRAALSFAATPDVLRHAINTGFSAAESVPFAIVTALRHVDEHGADFRAAVLEGVNAGQDTDTVGSMVGAIVGAAGGIEAIPAEWIDGLQGKEHVLASADALADLILATPRLD